MNPQNVEEVAVTASALVAVVVVVGTAVLLYVFVILRREQRGLETRNAMFRKLEGSPYCDLLEVLRTIGVIEADESLNLKKLVKGQYAIGRPEFASVVGSLVHGQTFGTEYLAVCLLELELDNTDEFFSEMSKSKRHSETTNMFLITYSEVSKGRDEEDRRNTELKNHQQVISSGLLAFGVTHRNDNNPRPGDAI